MDRPLKKELTKYGSGINFPVNGVCNGVLVWFERGMLNRNWNKAIFSLCHFCRKEGKNAFSTLTTKFTKYLLYTQIQQ